MLVLFNAVAVQAFATARIAAIALVLDSAHVEAERVLELVLLILLLMLLLLIAI